MAVTRKPFDCGEARPGAIRCHIRWLTLRDIPEVMAIERAGGGRPWSEEELLALLRCRNCIGMVAEHGDRVVGFMTYLLHKDRIELPRLAVAPDCRRRGVGGQMVDKLAGKLSTGRRTRVELVARETDLAGLLFLRARGFLAEGVERGHFDDVDGIRMAYEIDPEEWT